MNGPKWKRLPSTANGRCIDWMVVSARWAQRSETEYGEAEFRAHLDDNALQAAAERAASRIAKAMRFKAEHPHCAGDT